VEEIGVHFGAKKRRREFRKHRLIEAINNKLTERSTNPSAPDVGVPCVNSALYRMIAMKDAIMLSTEHVMATRPAMRAIPFSPGSVMSVTEALRMTAA
jgi:hypothetical protein